MLKIYAHTLLVNERGELKVQALMENGEVWICDPNGSGWEQLCAPKAELEERFNSEHPDESMVQ